MGAGAGAAEAREGDGAGASTSLGGAGVAAAATQEQAAGGSGRLAAMGADARSVAPWFFRPITALKMLCSEADAKIGSENRF